MQLHHGLSLRPTVELVAKKGSHMAASRCQLFALFSHRICQTVAARVRPEQEDVLCHFAGAV